VWGGAGDNTPHVWEVAEPGVGPLSKRGLVEFLNGVIPKHLTAGKPVETDLLPGLAIEIADGLDAVRSEGTASAGC
jgi:hypothetical protein